MGSLWAPQIRSSEPCRRSTLAAIQAPGLPIFCLPALRKPIVAKSILLEMQSYLFSAKKLHEMQSCLLAWAVHCDGRLSYEGCDSHFAIQNPDLCIWPYAARRRLIQNPRRMRLLRREW